MALYLLWQLIPHVVVTPAERNELFVLFGLAYKTSTLLGALIGGGIGVWLADEQKWNPVATGIVCALVGMTLWAALAGG